MTENENEISEGNPNESFEYFSLNENYYDILSDCKSLLTEQKMDSIRIIFKEIVDVQSIKRQIYINGIVDIPNKILFNTFLNSFLDYISDLDSFINVPLIFQEYDKKLKNGNDTNNSIYNKVYYVNSSKRNNIYNINGNVIYLEDLLERNEFKKQLKILIFWNDINDIDIQHYLNIAKNYNKYLSIIFISDIEGFIQKKKYLQENNYYRTLNPDNPNDNSIIKIIYILFLMKNFYMINIM